MTFKPGDPRPEGSGRKPGQQNKRTVAVKEALEAAFDELGGVDALIQWARRDPTEFFKIWGKMLPKDVNVNATLTLGELLDSMKKKLSEEKKEP